MARRGPRRKGPSEKLLRNSLELAKKHGIHSIAFPAISTDVYGYPLKAAAEIALKAVSTTWLEANSDYGMSVLFACYSDKAAKVYEEVCRDMEG